ncbi:MAG TPA: hypothetical protein VN577_04990 [Terriglobales bacterium]|nr:hypothetical protein [Terriglobales bacterium]
MKKTLAAATTQGGQTATLSDSAKVFALECWRIQKLLPDFKDNKKCLVLSSSIEKMIEAMRGNGIEIEDPEGLIYRDGMTLEVVTVSDTDALTAGSKVIAETLAPTIYVHNKVVQPAKVIISVGRGTSE